MTLTGRILPAILGVLLVVPSALAQETQNQNEPALPDIAPRVVEIRGQLEISLPSLQRQPLSGFNPPPRVATIPRDRIPYMEEYKQESVDLPNSPLNAPEPPPVASLIALQPRYGQIEASAGRYFSRAVRFRTEWPVSDAAAIYSRLDYHGSDGHEPKESLDNATASFDLLDAMVGLQFHARTVAVGGEVDGFLNKYRVYGAAPALNAPVRDEPPTRDGRGGGGTLWLRTQASTGVDLDARIRLATGTFETDALGDTPVGGLEEAFIRKENIFQGRAMLDLPLAGRQGLRGDMQFTGLGFDERAIGESVWMLDGAGGVQLALQRTLELRGLARIMSYSAGNDGPHSFVSPDLRLDFYPTTGVQLYAANRPRAEHHTTASLYRDSPYLVDEPVVQPTIYTMDARGGGRIILGVFEADLHAGYSRSPNFLFFRRASDLESNGYASGLVTAQYDNAEITYVGGDVAVNLPAGLNASAGITVRDGTLTELDEEIPYFGPIVGRGALSYSFAQGRGFLQATTTYESARRVDVGDSFKLGDYFDLDFMASYDITESIGALVRLENLSAGYLERWELHEESPFVVGVGIRARW